MFYVYVLYSEKYDRMYIGMSNDVNRRLKEHNSRQNRSTKAYAPWIVILKEEFGTRTAARKREKYLKSGIGIEYVKSLLN